MTSRSTLVPDAVTRDYCPREWQRRARQRPQRRRAVVLAPDVPGAVDGMGGWMVDRGLAGWEVTVLVARRGAERALRVLGAQVLDLDVITDPGFAAVPCHCLAVAAQIYTLDTRVRAIVDAELGHSHRETVIFGEELPGGLAAFVTQAPHRISLAGLAFKKRAVGLQSSGAVVATETIWTDCPPHRGAHRPDVLVWAG